MHQPFRNFFCTCLLIFFMGKADGQKGIIDSSSQKAKQFFDKIDAKVLDKLNKKYTRLQKRLVKSSLQSLASLKKSENKIYKKILSQDSIAAKRFITDAEKNYAKLNDLILANTDKAAGLKQYIPRLDSLENAFAFLNKSTKDIPGISDDKLSQVRALSKQLQGIQSQFRNTAHIQRYLQEQKKQLKGHLEKLKLGKEITSWNKKAYYYQQQVQEFKALTNNQEELEKRILSYVKTVPAFSDFMNANSFFSRFFPSSSRNASATPIPGLQQRAVLQQQFSQQLQGGVNLEQYMHGQVANAEGEWNQLKEKAKKLSAGNSESMMPDFKPNTQKTKPFLQRLELGANIQSQRPNGILPSISDLAFTAGYKLNDKSVMGVGVGYKVGWGTGLRNIRISHQGVGLRSFLDIKVKGNIWITGGYELNYQQEFSRIDQLNHLNLWQKSGLIGVSKKYVMGKRKIHLQLLWDFLSYEQIPQTQALKFRIGHLF